MPSSASVFSVLYVSAFIALAGITSYQPIFAVATPFPSPRTMASNAYARSLKYEAGPRAQDIKLNNTSDRSNYDPRAPSPFYNPGVYERDLLDLVSTSESSQTHANNFKQCAGSPETTSTSRSECTSSLALFTSDIQLLYGGLSDKGLGNYDRDDELETLLKDIINEVKDVLTSVYLLVSEIPLLNGPLGALVYEIKCIIEQLLDLTEDLTDATLNSLKPLLQELLGSFPPTCQDGLTGLCLR